MANLYTQKQTFDLAKMAGFDNVNAELAAAVAMSETLTFKDGKQYCNFDAIGDTTLVTATWGPSYGAWQIRSLIADEGTGRYRDATRLSEPLFNAKSAYTVWLNAGKSFSPWSTFTSGAYKGYLQAPVYNPKPVVPAGTYMVTGGDTLSGIGKKTGYSWTLIAAINNLVSPYTIFPGQVIILPDWQYKVQSGDTLSKIATTYSEVTWQRIAEYNALVNPNILSVGQSLKIPRYTSWDGKTLIR
jgi:LysM repeat protein